MLEGQVVEAVASLPEVVASLPQPAQVAQALAWPTEPIPTYLVPAPTDYPLFGAQGGPMTGMVGSNAHTELTTSQNKKLLNLLNKLQQEALRKLGFMERRGQRQNPAISEQAREHGMSWAEGFCPMLLCVAEGAHMCFMGSAIWGFLCCIPHVFIWCCTCCYWKCQRTETPEQVELAKITKRIEDLEKEIEANKAVETFEREIRPWTTSYVQPSQAWEADQSKAKDWC